MIGVGVAEEAGLIAALIRKMVQVAPASAITFIIVLLGGISSVASETGYLVLIPLGAAAFVRLGRHPLAGIAAAYAGVSASFFVNILITPADGIITEVTNEILGGVAPGAPELNVTHNLFFAIGSTLFTAIVMTVLTEKYVEPRLGVWDPSERAADAPADHVPTADELVHESRGLRLAGIYTLVAVAVVTLLTALPNAPLRNPETGEIFGTSPFMSSLLFTISMFFLAAGLGYGRGSGSLVGSTAVINAITKIFVPLFYNLGIAPQTLIAAHRVGDGPVNVVTPLMVYLPFIILLCQCYRFVIWYLTGIPWGPGAPVELPGG